jgi:hypothetical protein
MTYLIDLHKLDVPLEPYIFAQKTDRLLDEICTSLSHRAGFLIHGVRWVDPENISLETWAQMVVVSENPDDLVMFVLKQSR